MAILNTIKKGYMHLKVGGAYIKLLPRTLATLVSMSDGRSVENAIDELNRNFANVLGILTNIKGIYVGSKIAACNQAYALLHDTASLTKILGKAPTASNFICMVMNGDANAAQTSYYSPRYYSGDGLYVYVYPNVTGSIRINYVIFAIE